jgi:hypothetical protein
MHTADPITPSGASTQRRQDKPVEELDPLIGFVPVAGPPAVLLAGPLVLFALCVAGPFVLIVTLVALLAAAAALVTVVGCIVASPYLLVRHLRAGRATTRPSVRRPAAQLVPVNPRRVAA